MSDGARATLRPRGGTNGRCKTDDPSTWDQHSRHNQPHLDSVSFADDEGTANEPASDVATDPKMASSTKVDLTPSESADEPLAEDSHTSTHCLDVQADAFLEELATELPTKWEKDGSQQSQSVYGGGGGREG